jgi:Peptidase MA superfamily
MSRPIAGLPRTRFAGRPRSRTAGLPRVRRTGVWMAGLLAIAAAVATGPAVGASEAATFGTPTASASYGKQVAFHQPVTLSERPKRVEVLVQFPGAAGPQAIEVPTASSGAVTLSYELSVGSGSILPNTKLTARWRVTADDGTVSIGPPVSATYEDTRFDWKTRSGDLMTIHWYEGTEAFGRRALDVGDRAVRETSQLLGVTESERIDFFVYADQAAFYDVLGPGSRENVGGQANSEIRTLFALIEPNEIDQPWVDIVIPHELTHLVFDTAVRNPYHFPPRWLNEGLAVYLSEGYGSDYRSAVEDAARTGGLIPLGGLTGQFPTTRDRFLLAYGESVSSVDYLIRSHGRDALVGLIKSYARGLTDDEAFTEAIGVDVAAFDEAWRSDLDAKDPIAYGPKPAPAGPVPPGWTPTGQSADGRGPGSSELPEAPEAPSAARSGSSPTVPIALLGALVAGVVVVAVVVRRRGARPSP